jgi:hypothetical protein
VESELPKVRKSATLQVLPKRANDLILILLPRVVISKTDKALPNRAPARRDNDDPTRAKLNMLMALPPRMEERKLNELPIDKKSETDVADPILAKLLKLIEELKVETPMTESFVIEPKETQPKTDRLLPSLLNALILNELLMHTKDKTDRELPLRTKPLMEILDPRCR